MSDLPTTIRKFNPGTFQSDAALKEQFVVRHKEFDHMMDVVRGNIEAQSCRHVLLIGSRGQGKTMLLARVRAELRSKKTLAKHLLPVWFMEESHEIWNLADFWLETMTYVAAAVDDSSQADELRATHRRLAESDAGAKAVARDARDAVLQAANGRKLVLLVENLQALCDAMAGRGPISTPGIGWLRETLGKCAGQVMVLATATGRFSGVGPRQKFFDIIDLPPLNTNECQRLLESLDPDRQDRKDARALEILTGGNPRMLGIVASFVHKVSLDQLAEDMVSLIDEHTEYFRGYLENFARGERRVFIALADLWHPATAKEVAVRARMEIRSVSALLGRLVDRGTVAKAKGDDGKWRYEVAMRLVSIYYKLRRRENDVLVTSLFRFMATYYSAVALEMFDDVEAEFSPETRREIDRIMAGALNEAARNRTTPKDMLADCRDILKRFGSDESHRQHVQCELVKAHTLKGFAHSDLGDHEAALQAWKDAIEMSGASDDPKIGEQVAWALIGTGEAHWALIDTGEAHWALIDTGEAHHEKHAKENGEKALASYGEVVSRFEETTEPRLRLQLGRALLLQGALRRELDADGKGAKESFERACRVLDVQSEVGDRLAWYAVVCLIALDPRVDRNYAEQTYKPAVEQLRQDSPASATNVDQATGPKGRAAWYSKWLRAQSLFALGQNAAALETFRQAYVVYEPGDSRMISELFKFVDQVAAADSDDLLSGLRQVLASDKEKAEQLRPLTFALDAKKAGKDFQASAEMIAVGKDIQARIAGKRESRKGSSWFAAAEEATKRIIDTVLKEAEWWTKENVTGRKR